MTFTQMDSRPRGSAKVSIRSLSGGSATVAMRFLWGACSLAMLAVDPCACRWYSSHERMVGHWGMHHTTVACVTRLGHASRPPESNPMCSKLLELWKSHPHHRQAGIKSIYAVWQESSAELILPQHLPVGGNHAAPYSQMLCGLPFFCCE